MQISLDRRPFPSEARALIVTRLSASSRSVQRALHTSVQKVKYSSVLFPFPRSFYTLKSRGSPRSIKQPPLKTSANANTTQMEHDGSRAKRNCGRKLIFITGAAAESLNVTGQKRRRAVRRVDRLTRFPTDRCAGTNLHRPLCRFPLKSTAAPSIVNIVIIENDFLPARLIGAEYLFYLFRAIIVMQTQVSGTLG